MLNQSVTRGILLPELKFIREVIVSFLSHPLPT